MVKSMQAKSGTVIASKKSETNKNQDQIHQWLADYADSRDPFLRDSIINVALPLVKRSPTGWHAVLLTRSRI